MATYQKSEGTRQAILDAARVLFYEKGYTATHCKDIAQRAATNVGLIHYYYRAKGNIALQIYTDFLVQHLTLLEARFPEEDLLVRNAIAIRCLWHMLEKDGNLLRFFCEITPERIPLELASTNQGTNYTRALNESADAADSEESLFLVCCCSIASESELILRYASGQYGLSVEAFAEMDIRITLQMSSIPEARIGEVLRRSAACEGSVSMEVDQSFQLYFKEEPQT